jgi:glucose-1-phosphate cytidylyltransferase
MKVVILAGGLGTRLAEETVVKPKPMVEVGGRPILWHLLHIYSHFGFNEFVIALGYKAEVIKEYFSSFYRLNSDMTVDLSSGEVTIRSKVREPWVVHLVDTGADTMTGGRVGRLREIIGDETFMCTYGDGLASIDIRSLLDFHREQGREATLTAVRPPSRFGSLNLVDNEVVEFVEKPQFGEGWINGGFFVFEPSIFNRIEGDATILEHEPLMSLAKDRQLSVFRHSGFWQPMDTIRDKRYLDDLWATGEPPWVHRSPITQAGR